MIPTGPWNASGVHPEVAYQQSIIENLPDKTGKSVEQWVRLLRKSGPEGERARRDWLKKKHGLGGTTANILAGRLVGKGAEGTDAGVYLKTAVEYVEAMYSGPKANLRPMHDDRPALSRARVRRDQAVDPHPNRPGPGFEEVQEEAGEAVGPHRGARKGRPDHAPNPHHVP